MPDFAIITPTRGDRPELLNFLRSRIPAEYEHIIVDYKPFSEDVDLVNRIKHGIELAKQKGFDYVFIAEDDDYYPKDFFDTIHFEDTDFYGFATSHYYNLSNQTYQTFEHIDRSSLFCTGFRISALDRFNWPPANWKFLDIRLWEYANNGYFKIDLHHTNPCVGIKGHKFGKHAGKGHTMRLKYDDPTLSCLKEMVDMEAFQFYNKIIGE